MRIEGEIFGFGYCLPFGQEVVGLWCRTWKSLYLNIFELLLNL